MALPKPLTERQIKELALETLLGNVVWLNQLESLQAAGIVFPQIITDLPAYHTGAEMEQLTIYGHLEDARDVTVNGLPIFRRIHTILTTDAKAVEKRVRAAVDALEREN